MKKRTIILFLSCVLNCFAALCCKAQTPVSDSLIIVKAVDCVLRHCPDYYRPQFKPVVEHCCDSAINIPFCKVRFVWDSAKEHGGYFNTDTYATVTLRTDTLHVVSIERIDGLIIGWANEEDYNNDVWVMKYPDQTPLPICQGCSDTVGLYQKRVEAMQRERDFEARARQRVENWLDSQNITDPERRQYYIRRDSVQRDSLRRESLEQFKKR